MESLPPKDLSHHYSKLTKRTASSAIKAFYKYFSIPGIGNLAGGLPASNYFPFDTLEARTALPDRWTPTPNGPVPPSSVVPQKNKKLADSHVVVPHDSAAVDRLHQIDLATALQYGTAAGYPPLATWVRSFTRTKLHPNVPYTGGPEIILTDGSTDGFAKLLQIFSDIWDDERDWLRERQGILCEEFVYMQPLQCAKPRGLNIVPVAIDEEGMSVEGPRGLRNVLETWDKSKGKIPHIMYTVTMGHNPTSGILSVKRRKEIYKICQKYDILIIEDDPYWYMQYPSANKLSMEYRGKPVTPDYVAEASFEPNRKSSGSAFLDSLVPSYLSIDTDGRVMRLDTFSKTIAPGCRLGWITAQPEIIERVLRMTDLNTQQPSGFVQSLVAELILGPHPKFDEDPASEGDKKGAVAGWQTDGWIRWLEGLRGNYERRMQLISRVLEEGKYMVQHKGGDSRALDSGATNDDFEVITKKQLFDFAIPMAGMFIWLRVHFEHHPLFNNARVSHARLSLAYWVFLTTVNYRILVAPGSLFAATDEIRESKGWMYFRICFAAVPDDTLEHMGHRFVEGSNDFFEIDDPDVIDELLHDEDNPGFVDSLRQISLQTTDV